MTTARKRTALITFQRGTASSDEYGGETLTWATLSQEWAAVFYGRGSERRQAAQEQASQVATFQVPSSTNTRDIRPKDRIVHLSQNWDIVGPPALDTPKRGLVEIEAMRSL